MLKVVYPIVFIVFLSCGCAGSKNLGGSGVKETTTTFNSSSVRGMVPVPGGEFVMGSENGQDDEIPRRSVYVSVFYIDKYEVTADEYKRCVDAGECSAAKSGGYYNYGKSGRGRHPINGVTWAQSMAYCGWKGKKLPTEAQWEKAARGVDGRNYPWGNESVSCEKAQSPLCGDGTAEVGSKSGVSPYGAHDMAGNVWEWTADWYGSDYYRSAPERNPMGPEGGSFRVSRGGGWDFDGVYLRSSDRYGGSPGDTYFDLGFRCALSLRD